jgi:signal transduction histidine kinase
MRNNSVLNPLAKWTDEIKNTLLINNSLCIALFSLEKKLLFANDPMASFFKEEPSESLINPSFEEFLLMESKEGLIFEGYMTLGDYSSVNSSLWGQVYRKSNEIFIVGGVDAAQLSKQNELMHALNSKINNLQRDLIREKITLEKTLKKLNKANSELKEVNTSKNRFISILAHDLKNPIGSIANMLTVITEGININSNETSESRLKVVANSAQSTYGLLEELLSWERAQSGRTTFNPEIQPLITICDTVCENVSLTASNKNIKISNFDLEEIRAYADKEMLHAVLRNLVSNAIKFTPHNGLINVSAQDTGTEVLITVSDNGVGMDAETISKLFDVAHHVTTEGTDNEKGTGLGLLLCKELVETHGGKIWVESEFDNGSEFKFTLPNQKV